MASSNPSAHHDEGDRRTLKDLSFREWRTLVPIGVLLPVFAVGVRMAGYGRLRAFLARLGPEPRPMDSQAAVDDAKATGRLVNGAAARLPFPVSCLPRALTLWWLLRLRRMESDVRIGVRHEEGRLQAHAWVEGNGTVLNDKPDINERFAAFDPIDWPKGADWV